VFAQTPAQYAIQKGLGFAQKGELDSAIEAFQQATHLNPQDASAYFYLSQAYQETGNLEGAMSACQAAIRLLPNFAEAHSDLGQIYHTGQFAAAIDSYQKAITLRTEVAAFHCLGLSAIGSHGAILFKEGFEGGINPSVWNAPNTWQLADSGGVAGLGTKVLSIDGGEAGITMKKDFTDVVYEADFRAMNSGKITGFVFRAQDNANNFYMHQISADGSAHTPNNMRWHWKVGGTWNVEPIPFLNGEKVIPEVWYRARFIVKGFNFKVFVVEKAKGGKADMIQLGDWTDDKKGGTGNFASGAIGFRSSGGEAMQFDNIVVADRLEDITTPVEPRGKLATVWGTIKARQ